MNKKSPAFYGVLASLALIASYVESLVPLPVPVPGIRLGLANAVVLAVLELFGFREAFLVSVVRILLSGFLFGNLSSIFYSLGGGLLSLLLMNLLYKKGSFGTLGISMAGGVAHNLLFSGSSGSRSPDRSRHWHSGWGDPEKDQEERIQRMISYVRGELVQAMDTYAVLDVNGFGLRVFLTGRDLSALPPNGEEVRFHTYFMVKEDAMQLYGFLRPDDLEVYKLLLAVNGIGPKAAMGILSALSADDIRFAVLSGDEKTITKAPGIGKKTAQKLILELKDKFSLEEAFDKRLENAGSVPAGSGIMNDAKTEAVEALTALGYSNADALRAVKKAAVSDEMDTEEILKAALKNMF